MRWLSRVAWFFEGIRTQGETRPGLTAAGPTPFSCVCVCMSEILMWPPSLQYLSSLSPPRKTPTALLAMLLVPFYRWAWRHKCYGPVGAPCPLILGASQKHCAPQTGGERVNVGVRGWLFHLEGKPGLKKDEAQQRKSWLRGKSRGRSERGCGEGTNNSWQRRDLTEELTSLASVEDGWWRCCVAGPG